MSRNVRCTRLRRKGKPTLCDRELGRGDILCKDKVREVLCEEGDLTARHFSVITARTGEPQLKFWGALFGLVDPCSGPGISLV